MSRMKGGVLGRTVSASLKVTAIEQQILRDRYGSVPAGLRHGLELVLAGAELPDTDSDRPATKPAKPRTRRPRTTKARTVRPEPYVPEVPPEVLATMEPLVPAGTPAHDGLDAETDIDPWASARGETPAPHRHRRGEKLNEVYEHGTPIVTYRCATPGCTATLT